MIPRTARQTAERLAEGFPIVAITGSRQSGKTTLARAVFPGKLYVTLEDPEEREFAESDPRRFLARFPEGAVIDEAQRCPGLFSYLQDIVDRRGHMGEFILTGSQQFGRISGIMQTLAGRVGLIQLLPFSLAELALAGRLPDDLDTLLFQGGYPPLYDQPVAPSTRSVWCSSRTANCVRSKSSPVPRSLQTGSTPRGGGKNSPVTTR